MLLRSLYLPLLGCLALTACCAGCGAAAGSAAWEGRFAPPQAAEPLPPPAEADTAPGPGEGEQAPEPPAELPSDQVFRAAAPVESLPGVHPKAHA
jgi:hypothetical protein